MITLVHNCNEFPTALYNFHLNLTIAPPSIVTVIYNIYIANYTPLKIIKPKFGVVRSGASPFKYSN